MPKGAGERVILSMDTWKCHKCDILKTFRSVKAMHKYAALHARFCDATNGGCIDIMKHNGTKKDDVKRHEYTFEVNPKN